MSNINCQDIVYKSNNLQTIQGKILDITVIKYMYVLYLKWCSNWYRNHMCYTKHILKQKIESFLKKQNTSSKNHFLIFQK